MKVSELIEQLKQLPTDSNIKFESYDEVYNAEVKWRGGSDEPCIYLSHKYDKGEKPFMKICF